MRILLSSAFLPALVVGWLATGSTLAQVLTPENAQQKARFDAVTRAVSAAGYSGPAVVGLSPEGSGALFVLLATQKQKVVLLALIEPAGKEPAHPLVLETETSPANIGVGTVRFEPFLGEKDLFDVAIDHRPHRLEISSTFELHHVLRRTAGGELTLACDFNGNSTSSYSKGPRSVATTCTVTVEKTAGDAHSFDVKAVEERTESSPPAPAKTERTETITRYALTASGTYAPAKK